MFEQLSLKLKQILFFDLTVHFGLTSMCLCVSITYISLDIKMVW